MYCCNGLYYKREWINWRYLTDRRFLVSSIGCVELSQGGYINITSPTILVGLTGLTSFRSFQFLHVGTWIIRAKLPCYSNPDFLSGKKELHCFDSWKARLSPQYLSGLLPIACVQTSPEGKVCVCVGGGGGGGSVHKKKELLQLVDLDLNPPVKHAGLVPVRLGKLNKTVRRQWITGTGNTAGAQREVS